jgi:hypothetical protein
MNLLSHVESRLRAVERLGVGSGVTLTRIRVGFGASGFILYRGSLYMLHAVTTLFGIRSRTENPRVGGSIPSLATTSKAEAAERVTEKSHPRATIIELVANGVTLFRSLPRVDVRPVYERVSLRCQFAAWRWFA